MTVTLNLAIEASDLTAYEAALLRALHSYDLKKGERIFPSLASLSRRSKLKTTTLKKTLNSLEAKGWVTRSRTEKRTTQYCIHVQWSPDDHPGREATNPGREATPDRSRGDHPPISLKETRKDTLTARRARGEKPPWEANGLSREEKLALYGEHHKEWYGLHDRN